jgi:hypothetical protein
MGGVSGWFLVHGSKDAGPGARFEPAFWINE